MSIITIDTDQLGTFTEEGGKLVFQKEAEESLLQLLQLRDLVDHAIDQAKEKITQAAQAVDPNFKGIIGDSVRCTYRFYGEKYTFVEEQFETASPFLLKKEQFKVDSKKVEEYVKKHGDTPAGIILRDRAPKLSLQPIEDLAVLEKEV